MQVNMLKPPAELWDQKIEQLTYLKYDKDISDVYEKLRLRIQKKPELLYYI